MEARYGLAFVAHARSMIEEAGLAYAPGPVVSNSMRALQLAELGRDLGRWEGIHSLLFTAYWAEGRDIGDLDVLMDLAGAAELDPGEARAALDDGRYAERVQSSTGAAYRLGVDGVPGWLLDGRLLVPGAQPHEVFEGALERLGFQSLRRGALPAP